MPRDDYEQYYDERTPKAKKRKTNRLTGRDIVRRLSWLSHRPLYFGGPPQSMDQPAVVPECRHLTDIVCERLGGAAAGLYSVEITFATEDSTGLQPEIGETQLVTSRRLSDAAWLLSQISAKEKEIDKIVAGADTWRETMYHRLQRFSAVFQSSGSRQTEEAEGLAIEAHCGWIGSDRLRPSRLLGTRELEDHLEDIEDGILPTQYLAAMVLGRRAHARVPQELAPHKLLGQLLRTWPPDLLALIAEPKLTRRILAMAQEWPDLDRPECGSALREYQLLGDRTTITDFIAALPSITSAWKRVEQEPRERKRKVLELIGRALHEESHVRVSPTGTRRWNREFDRVCRNMLTEQLIADGIPVDVIGKRRDPFLSLGKWYFGIDVPESQLAHIRALDEEPERDPSMVLMERVGNVLKTRSRVPRPVGRAMAALVGRIAAVGTPNVAMPKFASWLDHCRKVCLPGTQICGPARLAVAILASTIDQLGADPNQVERTLELAEQYGEQLLRGAAARLGTTGRPPACHELASSFVGSENDTLGPLMGLGTNPLAALATIPPLYEDFVPVFIETGLLDWLLCIYAKRRQAVPIALTFLAEVDDEWYKLPAYSQRTWAELFQLGDEQLAERLAMWTVELVRDRVGNWDDMVYFLEDVMRFLIWADTKNERRIEFLNDHFIVLEQILAAAVRVTTRTRKQDNWQVADVFTWRTTLLEVAFFWHEAGYGNVYSLVSKLSDACDRQDARLLAQKSPEPQAYFPLGVDSQLSVLLSEGSLKRLLNCLQHNPQQTYQYPADPEDAWAFLDKHPTVRRFLSRATERPELIIRVKLLMRRLALALRLKSTYELRTDLTQWENVQPAPTSATPKGTPESCREQMLTFISWLKLVQNNTDLPKSIAKILSRPDHLEAELQSLTAKVEKSSASDGVKNRLENVRRYLEDPAELDAWIARDLTRELEKQVVLQRLLGMENVVARAIERHWSLLNPDLDIHTDPNWDNALLMCLTASKNRRLLKDMLRKIASGESRGLLMHANNQRFLKAVAAKGVDPEQWCGPFERDWTIEGEPCRIYVEQDPLRVLQMGNLFDTCLSVGGEKSYAAIANAVEINKRVIYVDNSRGHVIGRKLVAMNRKGVVFGFNTYGRGIGMKSALDRFCREWFHECGARFPEKGDTQDFDWDTLHLFAAWYYDGIEPFDWWSTGDRNREDLAGDLLKNFPKHWHHDEVAVIRALLHLGKESIPIIEKHEAKIPGHSLRRLRRHTRDPELREFLDLVL